MIENNTYTTSENSAIPWKQKISDYSELLKLKLNLLVVTTSFLAYLMTATGVNFLDILVLLVGGLLISGSAGAMNEIFEKDSDAEMKRTQDRPLPAGRMQKQEAWIVSLVSLILGLVMLAWRFNWLTVALSIAVVILYAFIYTPMKKTTPISVLVGAIPGALPPVIGIAAATGQITALAVFLFVLQFMWQFPHFWAVAFMAKEDYAKAGFRMIPNNMEQSRFIAIQSVFYASSLILMSAFAKMYGVGDAISMIGLALSGFVFTMYAVRFYKKFDYASARRLMFASIIYLPIVYLIIFLDFLI